METFPVDQFISLLAQT